MNIFITTIAAVLIFAVLIFVHELGHFIAAKLFHVRVNEFALGMGPKLFKKQKGETLYSIRLIPLGGFCAMEGEDEDTGDERAFSKKKPLARLIILASGAFMNLLLGFLLLLILSGSNDKVVQPEIAQVASGSGAEEAGLMPGDEIVRVNGKRVHIIDDLSWALTQAPNEDQSLAMVVQNAEGQKRNVTVFPKENRDGEKSYGIVFNTVDNNVLQTLRTSWYRTGFYSGVIVESFGNLITGNVPLSQVSGPVGIVSEIGTTVEATKDNGWVGFLSLMSLVILLTINLGVFNLLPIPALDGGRIFFVLIELIFRKPVPLEKEAMVHFIGMALLVLLSILIAFKDVFMLWV